MKQIYRQGELLTALHRGAYIIVEHTNEPPSEARTSYKLNTGQTVHKTLIAALEQAGLIKRNDDALFSDGPPQTYVIAHDL